MITFTYPNGFTADYDETLKVGDLITCYNEGYHRITEIEDRPGRPPLISYVKVCKIDGSYSKKLKGNCCSSYCRRAYDSITKELQVHHEAIKALHALIVDNHL